MFRYVTGLILAFAAAGCTYHSDAMHTRGVSESYQSQLRPAALANCIVRASVRPMKISTSPDGEVRVDDAGPYGFKFEQWSIYPDGTGSRAEFRRTRMGGSHHSERACFSG